MRDEVVPAVRAACEKEADSIVALNQLQLLSGENVDGKLMNDGVYSEHYARYRQHRGLPIDRVLLDLTGDLQDGMRVEFTDTGFSIVSSDWKQWMVDYTRETGSWPPGNKPHYGQVFGLSKINIEQLVYEIRPIVANRLRKRLMG